MHYRMIITLDASADTESSSVRREVYNRLAEDDSFCGYGGLFGSPLCDWFVIGGRWSGLLAEAAIGKAFKDAVCLRFPELAREWWPQSGNGRVKVTHPGRLILTHLGLQNGRSGQERQPQVTRPFGPSLLSSTRGTGSSRHSSRKCSSGGSVGRAAPPSSAPPGRSGSTR
jgi:hypothetical protein